MSPVSKFVAIDFETANHSRSSACAVGLAWVESGQVSRTESYLIQPPGNQFHPFNIRVHGIRPEHVANQPTFDQVWKVIHPRIAGHLLIAHNASFDRSVLEQSLAAYRLGVPPFTFKCTVEISRRVWPELTDHKLPTVARHLGIPLKHHDAASDAFACASIALAAMSRKTIGDLGRV
jgi:DNA polymerase-3 subunit epsilon